MSEESSELIERVNLAAKRFVEAKAAAKKQQEDEEERGFRDISPSSSSSSYNPSSSTDFSYGVMNADDVLKSMVARKVEMQNTAMDLDTSRKFEDMQNEVSKLSEEFDRNKPTAGKSKTALRREARRQEVDDMSVKLAVRMKELEERMSQVKLEDERKEREFQERMKLKASKEAEKLQATRDNLSSEVSPTSECSK